MDFQKKDNMFKLVPHDVGILTKMIGMTYQGIKAGKDAYKGFVAEVFVLNEVVSSMAFPEEENELFSFKRAVSLTNFVEKYKPHSAFKFTFNNVENNPQRVVQHLPIYKIRAIYAKYFKDG